MKVSHLLQIDLLKGYAILSVIALHIVASAVLLGFPILTTVKWDNLWIGQAVPVFAVTMGLNAGASFARRRYTTFRDTYSRAYLEGRFWRIVFPFFLFALFFVFFGLVLTRLTGQNQLYLGPRVLIGYLPLTKIAIGNYYVALVFEFIVLFPIMYLAYRRYPRLTLVSCFVGNLLFEFIAPLIMGYNLYNVFILRYLFAIALGLWIADDYDLFSKRNRFILVGAVLSIGYLLGSDIVGYDLIPYFMPYWYTQNTIAFFYAALLVLAGIKYLPKTSKNRLVNGLAHVGLASFHIFLVQMLWFLVFTYFVVLPVAGRPTNFVLFVGLLFAVTSFVLCVACGLLFMAVDGALQEWSKLYVQQLAKKRSERRSTSSVRPLLITFNGVDGAGKSTLTKALVEQLKRHGVRTEYLWWFTAENSRLRRMLRSMADGISAKRASVNNSAHKLGLLQTVYQYLVLLDYERQALFRVALPLLCGRNVICDRYVSDVAISFAVEFGYTPARTKRLIRALQMLAPRPDIAFLVDVPAEIAMRRKSDIDSAKQHEGLRNLYLRLLNDEGVVLLDGSSSLDELNERVWVQVSERLAHRRGGALE